MIRKLLTIVCIIFSIVLNAQKTIKGVVLNTKNVPIVGAAIYLNNTSIGTTSGFDGEFSLNVPKGEFDLIISFLGYRTMSYPLKNGKYTDSFKFKLRAKNYLLNEIVIPKKIKKSERRKYLRMFRENFLGQSTYAQKARIFNEKHIKFSFDEKNNILTAFAEEPLKIINNYLGYKILYDLLEFKMIGNRVVYSGTARFESLSGTADDLREWNKNRNEIYYGSSNHFLNSIMNEKISSEKYIIDNIRLIRNPNYPTVSEIAKAKRILRNHKRKQRPNYRKNIHPNIDVKKAMEVLKRTRLPKFNSEIVKSKLDYFEYSNYDGTRTYLDFDNYLKITYYGNSPNKNYNKVKQKDFKYQVSLIKLKNDIAVIENPGILTNPLDIYTEGYWAFKRIGDLLPLNYKPL